MGRIFFALPLVVLLSLYCEASEDTAVAFLLDVSKSVSIQDFEKAKSMIGRMSESSGSTSGFSIYTFAGELKKINREELSKAEASESKTRIYDAAYEVARGLSSSSAARKKIFIFSDGQDTGSAMLPDDLVSFAKAENISIYSIGIGAEKKKDLQRSAMLTGGAHFEINDSDLIDKITEAISKQNAPLVAPSPEAGEPKASAVSPLPPAAAPAAPAATPVATKESGSRIPYWGLWTVLGILLAAGIGFLLIRKKAAVRVCPQCGRTLRPDEIGCPDCASQTKIVPVAEIQEDGDDTGEIPLTLETPGVPREWLEPSELTQEILSRTFVLVETPLLLVSKGKDLGQAFRLSKEVPISIGRSRVNEVRLDDLSVSAQHCRIIPDENRYLLHDLGSTNGTFVNEKRVATVVLVQGDRIKVGETEFTYKLEQSHPSGYDLPS